MPPLHVFNGKQLSIARIRELSVCSGVVDLAPEAWERVAASRAIVERHMAAGATIYGTNTGIGSQKDVAVAARDLAAFSNRMIISEATDFPGPPISDPAVRAALVVLINMVAGGRTGMRPALVERLLELYAAPRMPTVRADTAFGTADLTPLSQLSLALLGISLDDRAPVLPTPFDLAPKESVSLIDNNSFALGDGALVLTEAERLLAGIRSGRRLGAGGISRRPACAGRAGRGRRSRCRVRRDPARISRGCSKAVPYINPDQTRFLQDPLSFRSITQIHGAALRSVGMDQDPIRAGDQFVR